MIFLLGPLTRQVYDQFGRVALKSVDIRRNRVLSVFNWPYADARARLEQLPVLGSVLLVESSLKLSRGKLRDIVWFLKLPSLRRPGALLQ